ASIAHAQGHQVPAHSPVVAKGVGSAAAGDESPGTEEQAPHRPERCAENTRDLHAGDATPQPSPVPSGVALGSRCHCWNEVAFAATRRDESDALDREQPSRRGSGGSEPHLIPLTGTGCARCRLSVPARAARTTSRPRPTRP